MAEESKNVPELDLEQVESFLTGEIQLVLLPELALLTEELQTHMMLKHKLLAQVHPASQASAGQQPQHQNCFENLSAVTQLTPEEQNQVEQAAKRSSRDCRSLAINIHRQRELATKSKIDLFNQGLRFRLISAVQAYFDTAARLDDNILNPAIHRFTALAAQPNFPGQYLPLPKLCPSPGAVVCEKGPGPGLGPEARPEAQLEPPREAQPELQVPSPHAAQPPQPPQPAQAESVLFGQAQEMLTQIAPILTFLSGFGPPRMS